MPRRADDASPAGADGAIVRVDDGDVVVVESIGGNPLASDWTMPEGSGDTPRLVWSGTLGDTLFEPHPATWLRPGHERLAAFLDRVTPTLPGRLILHPHARHVLNDAGSCAALVRERSSPTPGVALAPAALLESSMLGDLDDHLTRIFQTLGPIADLVVLHDAAPGDPPAAVPLGAGIMPRDLVRTLLADCVDPATPIVLRPGDLDRQGDWLGG